MEHSQDARLEVRFLVVAFDRLAAAHLSCLLREDVPEAEVSTVHSAAEVEIAIAEPFSLVVLDTRNIDDPLAILEALAPLSETGCRIAVIVIDERPEHLRWAVGARQSIGIPHGIMPATMTPAQCRAAIVRVATGYEYWNWALRGAQGSLTPEARFPAEPAETTASGIVEALTPRESQILQLLKQGLRNKEVAERLAISVNTAKIHIASIKRKYRASSRMQLL
jgi:DNA-binding NarL/FixJ family response regulator